MLSAFPKLLTYALLAPFIIRVAIGLFFTFAGFVKIFKKRERFVSIFSKAGLPFPSALVWVVGLVELIGGVSMVAGFETQICAVVFALISIKALYIKIRHPELLDQTISFYALVIVMCASLLFSGAGSFAIDLPL